MPTAVVEARYVNKPDKNPDFGSIRTPDGTYYGFHKLMLGQFKEGGIYEIFYETKQGRTGKEFHTIKTVKAHESRTAPAAAKVLGDVQRARTNEADAERMWVCSLLGHAIQGGKLEITRTDIVEAGEVFLDAHRLIFSPKKSPQDKAESADAMDDEIPY